jgi:hypothetical protein
LSIALREFATEQRREFGSVKFMEVNLETVISFAEDAGIGSRSELEAAVRRIIIAVAA